LKESNKHISIIIPVYNSQDCLEKLHSTIIDALQNISFEIIFINDGSTDNSWNKISLLSENDKKVKGINFSRNFGQNNALLAGLKNCTGDYAVIMDDDLQHDPKDIVVLLNECEKGFDVCFALFDNLKQKGWKNAGSNLNGKVAEWFINKPKEIYLSPFKVIRRNVIDRIAQYKGSYPYIDVMILQSTSSFTQIKVKHHDRFSGKGNFTLRKSLVVFLSHLFSYSVFPLKMLTWLGVLSAILSFGLGLYYLLEYFINGFHVEGWITLTLLLLFFGGLILFALGIIGNYISRIYQSGNFPEPFSIKEKRNLN
jgi:glycosyltransferase involved in cell wall biosynthesis